MQRIKSTFSAPLLILVIYGLLVSSRYINLESLKFKDNVYLSMIILQLMIFILPGIFYCKLRGSIVEKIKVKRMSPSKIWFVISVFGVLVFGSTLINTVTFHIFGNETQTSLYDTFTPLGGSQINNLIYIVISLSIVPAITEEYIFRGIVLSEYIEYGTQTAILMSGIMFAMVHFNLNHFFVYFFFGAVAAYAVYITQSIWSSILLHLLYNLYALFFESTLWDVIKSPNSLIFFLFVIMTFFIVFLVLSFNGAENILYTAGIKGEKSPPEAKKREGGIKLLIESLISPSFLACILLFLVVTLILK